MKTNTIKHTPTPWTYQKSPTGIRYIHADNKIDIAEVYGHADGINNAELNLRDDVNAEFIVRACNAHEELIQALNHLIACADCSAPELPEALNYARAVLAKTEGKV